MRFASILFTLSLAICAGCGQSERTVEPSADTVDVRLAVMPVADCEPFIRAKQLGLYDSLGVRVELTVVNSAMDIDTAVIGGSVNMWFTDTVRFARLKKRLPETDTLCSWTASLWCVVSDTTVSSARGLASRTVGMTRESAPHRLFDRLLADNGFEEGDVFAIQVNDVNLRREMLEHGLITAAFLPHPQSDSAVANGMRRIACADSVERFAIAYRPGKRLTREKVALVLKACEGAAASTRPTNAR